MPSLTRPTSRVHASFLAAMSEFAAEGRGAPDDDTMIGQEISRYAGRWADPAAFEEYVGWLCAQAQEESPRPPGFVPSTTLWWVSEDEYLGRITIRHRLTPRLRDYGGHVGYDVRPSARRRGHATAMLAAALPVAKALGIDPALITCDKDNLASTKVIEASGGMLEDQRGIKLRFWLPTS
jgi:predicted acetyltransferase